MELMLRTGEIIKEILQTKKNYFELVTQVEKKEKLDPQTKSTMINLIGSFLRNYYFIKHVENFIYDSKDINVVIQIGLYFVNNAYVHAISKEESKEHLSEYLKSIKRDFSNDRQTVLDGICEQRKSYYFSNLSKSRFKSLSVKLNLPEWFIRLLFSNYGSEIAKQTCREMSRMPLQFAILNPFKLLNGDVKTEIDKDFKLVKDTENVYLYNRKVSLRKHPLIKNKSLFQIQLGYLKLFNDLEELRHSNVSIYLGNKNNVYFPLLKKYATNGNNVSVITKHLYENYDLLTKIKEYQIKNTHFYEANEDGLEPYLNKKQDLLLYFANSSEFENFRIEPDYSIFFESNSLDVLIKEELEGLENVSKHVSEKGTLVYSVRTLGKKETTEIVKQFIEKHPEYELTKEVQFFPYEEDNSIIYYAILRKKA